MGQGRVTTDEYLSVSDVAEQLGVSRQTVYRWVKQHRIESQVYNDGRLVRVRQSAVDAFLTGTRHAASASHNGRAS